MPSHQTRPGRINLRTLLMFAAIIVLISLLGVLIGHWRTASAPNTAIWTTPAAQDVIHSATPALSATPSPSVKPAPVLSLNVKFPHSGPHTYALAKSFGPVLGTSGPIRTFHIAIESNIKVVTLAEAVAKIDATLGDRRSWVAGKKYRLQLVPASIPARFTIYLVTSATSSSLCAPLFTDGYTSCRQGSRVVLNLDRWMRSVPDYIHAKVPLDTYRTYMINHEVGHALGNGHELCPGRGMPAPVMEQQTLGLHGCTANPWPYLEGKRYDGPLGRY